jgi:ferredoxin
MAKYKIIFDRNSCIGAGECESLSPEIWSMGNDSKIDLKRATPRAHGIYELEIPESSFDRQRLVAGACLSGCIKVVRLE